MLDLKDHNGKIDIKSMTPEELEAFLKELGEKPFRAKQIYDWLHVKLAERFEEMTSISKELQRKLDEACSLTCLRVVDEKVSNIDGTRKYLFALADGNIIESVWMQYHHGNSVCISSQAGCRMGCRFCATGRQGLQESLPAAEILNQIVSLPERDRLTNLVFMGMGEPLDNPDQLLRTLSVITSEWGFGWSPTRITLSTAGVVPELRRLLDSTKVHLAVSLHNPFHEERAAIMPVERAWPVAEVAAILRRYDFTHQRRVSFEYIVMSGLNDSPRHIRELCRLLDGIKCRINLIRFHKIPGSPYFSPDDAAMVRLRDTLTAKGIQTTIRASRGEDIQAACGLLSTSALEGGQ